MILWGDILNTYLSESSDELSDRIRSLSWNPEDSERLYINDDTEWVQADLSVDDALINEDDAYKYRLGIDD